ncbi:hypothetical protein B0T17DRAFT_513603 [Bombardia bombarda]|uniref:Uncharacterized protein n=1 Tax=Bombardia bombarda TaxID=252184 RepID=A0AA39XK55_9PEZI|nr:hypothetical protein B0T17DRAFT_513603 [Bombardia bombarda]
MSGHDLYSMETSLISDALLRTVYASDQEMYPGPLSLERLRAWIEACSELSICFNQQQQQNQGLPVPMGVVIVLPLLEKHWKDLLVGELKETEIDSHSMFPLSRIRGSGGGGGEDDLLEEEKAVVPVGLHVFHIERFPVFKQQESLPSKTRSTRGFAEFAIEEIMRRVTTRDWGRRWKVLGLSALTATAAGKKTFERLGFTPTGYREIFTAPVAVVAAAADSGGHHTTRGVEIEMICIYPGEEADLASSVLQRGGRGCRIVGSPSEMVVKYGSI